MKSEKNNLTQEILVSLYDIANILENKGYFLGYKNKKWILFSNELGKNKKIIESSTLQSIVDYCNKNLESN